MEQQKLNYEQEFGLIQQNNQNQKKYWKSTSGRYKIKVLDEPSQFFFLDKNSGLGRTLIQIPVLVDGIEYIWSINKSIKDLTSTWGQLCMLAVKNNNHLKDLVFDVVVLGEGIKKTYTIISR